MPVPPPPTPVTYIEIDDERDVDEIARKLKAHNRVLVEADVPGAGKTFAVMHAFKDACLSTPVNRLCQQLHWDHPEAMVQTVATFFGVRGVQRSDDDRDDDGRGHRCRVDFGDRIRVFDEAHMMSGQDMLRTLRWIHDNLKFECMPRETLFSSITQARRGSPRWRASHGQVVSVAHPTAIEQAVHSGRSTPDRTYLQGVTRIPKCRRSPCDPPTRISHDDEHGRSRADDARGLRGGSVPK